MIVVYTIFYIQYFLKYLLKLVKKKLNEQDHYSSGGKDTFHQIPTHATSSGEKHIHFHVGVSIVLSIYPMGDIYSDR